MSRFHPFSHCMYKAIFVYSALMALPFSPLFSLYVQSCFLSTAPLWLSPFRPFSHCMYKAVFVYRAVVALPFSQLFSLYVQSCFCLQSPCSSPLFVPFLIVCTKLFLSTEPLWCSPFRPFSHFMYKAIFVALPSPVEFFGLYINNIGFFNLKVLYLYIYCRCVYFTT